MFLKDTVVARTVELDKYRWHGFRDFGRASRPWLHRARRRDGPWGRRRLQDYMTPMLRASETSWHARMPREYARRIMVAIVQRKNFDPDVGSETATKINGWNSWLWKGRMGMNHPDPFVLHLGRWNARETT